VRVWLLLSLLTACTRLPPGEPCEATGDGFTRRDPCSYTCVEWEVPCADGSAVAPGVCSGPACSTSEDCDPGFACARTGSVASSCLPVDVCGSEGFQEESAAAALPPGSEPRELDPSLLGPVSP